MRTAEEMYQYCVDKDIASSIKPSWARKNFPLVVDKLEPGEEISACFIGLHKYICMFLHQDNFVYAVTDKRIIYAQKKYIFKRVKSVSLDAVKSVTMKKKFLIGVVKIKTQKGTIKVAMHHEEAKIVTDILHQVI